MLMDPRPKLSKPALPAVCVCVLCVCVCVCVCGVWIAPLVHDLTTIMRTPHEHTTTTHTPFCCQHHRNSCHTAAAPINWLPPPPHAAQAAAGERAKSPQPQRAVWEAHRDDTTPTPSARTLP